MDDKFPPMTRRELLAFTGIAALAGCSLPNSGVRQRQQGTTQQTAQQTDDNQQAETVRAFIGSYHWGYFILDEDGAEVDQLTLSSGDELRLTLFNVEAEGAIDGLPQAVRTNIPSAEDRAQRNEQAIPVPQGTTLETLHEAAEAAYPDHSLAILNDEYMWNRSGGSGQGQGQGQGPGSGGLGRPWGGHHGPHGGPYGPGQGGRGPRQGTQGPGQGPSGPSGPGTSWCGPGMHGYGWGSGNDGTLAPPVYLWHHSTVPSELGFVVNTTGSFGFVCTVYCGYGHPYMAERSRIVVD
ncbi:cupredoxin domain-containing protein [Haloarcula amylovorans]|uniref:hypothetical protein n=1 Tax=Haloarcula amylovorans TaxID=2562280 RepID=UPI001ADDB13E|nr:hypothetical protein [Halomicroarcula amylolytica]